MVTNYCYFLKLHNFIRNVHVILFHVIVMLAGLAYKSNMKIISHWSITKVRNLLSLKCLTSLFSPFGLLFGIFIWLSELLLFLLQDVDAEGAIFHNATLREWVKELLSFMFVIFLCIVFLMILLFPRKDVNLLGQIYVEPY